MEELIKNIWKILIGFFLIIAAIIIVLLLIFPALGWKIYVSITRENRKARDIMTGTGSFFKAIAISIDLFGNVAYNGFFNNILLINQIYKFGSPYETISEVLGWGQYYNDLTKSGIWLAAVLDWIDPNHCELTRLYAIGLAKNKITMESKHLLEV